MLAPTNSKSLLHFLFNQMKKLDDKEVSVQEAQTQANIAKQANNLLNYELKRAQVEMEIEKTGSHVGIRDIELTNPVE